MRRALVALLALGALGLSACSSDPEADTEVRLGTVLALTGDSAALGQSQREAVDLALEQFEAARSEGDDDAPEFTIEARDEATSVAAGERGVTELVDQGVDVIVGPTHSNVARVAYADADVAEIPMLGVSLTVPGLTAFRPYLWRTSLAGDRVVPPAVRAAVSRHHPSTAYIVYGVDDVLTAAEAELFADTLTEEGVSVVGRTTFVKNQRSFASQIATAKAAGADILCVAALPNDAVHFLQQARADGLDAPVIGGNGFNSNAILTEAGAAAEGLTVGAAWSATSSEPESMRFVAAFTAKYGRPPDQFAAQAYAGMQVLAAAAREGGATPAGIQRGFRELGAIDTVLGRFSFDDRRDAVHPSWISVVEGGRFVTRRADNG
jgi:branched-chain amino acid transport system substrate-binding protein